MAGLNVTVTEQAAMIAYNNNFGLMMVLSLGIDPTGLPDAQRPGAVLSRFSRRVMMMQGATVQLVGFPGTRSPTAAWAIVLACALCVSDYIVGLDFVRPTPPSAVLVFDRRSLHGEEGPANDTACNIALGGEIEGDWWTLFRSDAIDQLVKQAVDHKRSLPASMSTLAQAQELGPGRGPVAPQVGLTAGVGRQQYGDQFLGGFRIPPIRTSPSAYRELHARLYRRCRAQRGATVRAGRGGAHPSSMRPI